MPQTQRAGDWMRWKPRTDVSFALDRMIFYFTPVSSQIPKISRYLPKENTNFNHGLRHWLANAITLVCILSKHVLKIKDRCWYNERSRPYRYPSITRDRTKFKKKIRKSVGLGLLSLKTARVGHTQKNWEEKLMREGHYTRNKLHIECRSGNRKITRLDYFSIDMYIPLNVDKNVKWRQRYLNCMVGKWMKAWYGRFLPLMGLTRPNVKLLNHQQLKDTSSDSVKKETADVAYW
jgi:hypothetical protein